MIQRKHQYNTDWLADAARDLLPSTVAIATSDPRRGWQGLHPEEIPATATMAVSRRLEYTAGRIAARDAMSQISVYNKPVITGQDRAPIWPAGLVGSISHTKDYCVAAVAHSNDIHIMGIDIEPNRPLDAVLSYEICNSAERAWLAQQPACQQGTFARLIFSAKECTYKCQYMLTRKLFGFKALNVEIDLATASFCATFTQPVSLFPTGYRLAGRFFMGQGIIMTTMVIEQSVLTISNDSEGI
ncbi:MAG: 4'-phosphopantetheinyl transferase superfamily protein [Amylibacter sp.]